MFIRTIIRRISTACYRRNSNGSSAPSCGVFGAAVSANRRTHITCTGVRRRCGPLPCRNGSEVTRRGAPTGPIRTGRRRQGRPVGTSWKCTCSSRARSRWSSAAAATRTWRSCAFEPLVPSTIPRWLTVFCTVLGLKKWRKIIKSNNAVEQNIVPVYQLTTNENRFWKSLLKYFVKMTGGRIRPT